MHRIIIILWSLIYLSFSGLFAQNAPLTTAGSYTGYDASVSIPLTVSNFTNIGSFNLKLSYNPSVITPISIVSSTILGGNFAANIRVPGEITIGWYDFPGISLPDNSLIFTINFVKVSVGTSALLWIDNGYSCQYNDEDGNPLNDIPTSNYYFNGSVTFLPGAPHTIGPHMSACQSTVIGIPVKVTQFNHIGRLALNLHYNTVSLTYQSFTNNSGFPNLSINSTSPGTIVISGLVPVSGNEISLADSAVLFTLYFSYLGGTTGLSWFDDGTSCEYAAYFGGNSYFPLNDTPRTTYYIDGQVSPILITNFTANNFTPEVNNPVVFTDNSIGNPSAWNWTFSPGSYVFLDGTNAGSQNPHVKFTLNGSYSTSLTITKNICSNSKSINDYIHAGTPGLWTGINSNDWNTPANWHNYLIPDELIDVVIPLLSPNWPIFNGNFIIGTGCKSISLGVTNPLN